MRFLKKKALKKLKASAPHFQKQIPVQLCIIREREKGGVA